MYTYMCVYLSIYLSIHLSLSLYIYIYIERERDTCVYTFYIFYKCIYVCIYIYIHIGRGVCATVLIDSPIRIYPFRMKLFEAHETMA